MPMILDVGPRLSATSTPGMSDEPLGLSRASAAPFWSLELPGLYGLDPLARVAAGLAIHGTPPPPLATGEMDWDLISEARDLESDRFPVFNGPAGKFSAEPGLLQPDEVADLRSLKSEVESLLEHLSGPEDLATALQEVGSKPLSLEWCLGLSLRLACDVALAMELPLVYRWRYPLKPPEHPVGDIDAFHWGLGEMTEASLDPEGAALLIRFVGGYRYRIPLDYLVSWDLEAPRRDGVRATSVTLDEWGYRVTGRLADGGDYDATYVSILAGCEPSFEHFGGWTEEADENVQRGFERWGPFRLESE